MSDRIRLTIHRQAGTNAIQASIDADLPNGAGIGFRLIGPKFCACHPSREIGHATLDERDAQEIVRYLRRGGLLGEDQTERALDSWRKRAHLAEARLQALEVTR